jgi:hypothetical protein
MTFDPSALFAAFPPKAISWRAQSVSAKNPEAPKAMALAYIDARDVMNRLDEVCGPDGWEDSYVETPLGRVICTIRVRCGEQWVSKSDGAGKTDVEGDKGGISDAFKRAAVKWGIGRYLYDMPTPWVACELYNGKWSKWTAAGLAELERIAKGVAPTPIKTDPNAKISDQQRDWLIGKAEASVGVAELCKHFGKISLKDFTVGELEPARDWLKSPTAKAA